MNSKITSHNQSGGITAQNITVSSSPAPASPHAEFVAGQSKGSRIWIYVSSGVALVASIVGILEYFDITPW